MKKNKQAETISTFLGPEARIEGTVEFQGAIRMDGSVNGKVQSNGGTVIIGEQAVITANISVGTAVVRGEVKGTINAQERIELYAPGRVMGDIQAPEIAIEAGVVLHGRCTTPPRPQPSVPSKTASKVKPTADTVEA